jgi:hypothetical protein
MATYIPNITGINPGPVDTKLDIDRIQKMLVLRESLYQEGVTKVKTLYSSAFNSPMLRDGNIKRRDEYLKLINEGLKNVSAMDLSISQNQNIASSLFEPVLADTELIHDIKYTRDLKEGLQYAENLKNSSNAEERKRYSDVGIQYMNYKAEEYKNADSQTALGMSAPDYVENVNMLDYAQKMFKESGISVTQDEISGNYIFTKKNGDAVYPITQEYVSTLFAQDPAIKQLLAAEAYVKRKNFIKTNATRYGGEYQAEAQYLKDNLTTQFVAAQKDLENNEKSLKSAKDKLYAYGQMMKKNGVTSYQNSPLYVQLTDQIQQYETVIQDKKQNLLSQSQINYNNLNDMRMAVDNSVLYNSYAVQTNLIAKYLAFRDASFTIKQEPFQMEAYQSSLQLRNQQIMASLNHQYDLLRDQAKLELELQDDIERKKLGLEPRGRKKEEEGKKKGVPPPPHAIN